MCHGCYTFLVHVKPESSRSGVGGVVPLIGTAVLLSNLFSCRYYRYACCCQLGRSFVFSMPSHQGTDLFKSIGRPVRPSPAQSAGVSQLLLPCILFFAEILS